MSSNSEIDNSMSMPIIFCIDDEQNILQSLKDQLNHHLADQCQIELSDNPADAIDLHEELMEDNKEVGVIIADYIMPDMKGDRLLSLLHRKSPDALNILLTGQADVEGIGNAVNNANLYRYLKKPWDANDLIITVSRALQSFNDKKQLQRKTRLLSIMNSELQQIFDNSHEGITYHSLLDSELISFNTKILDLFNIKDGNQLTNEILTQEQLASIFGGEYKENIKRNLLEEGSFNIITELKKSGGEPIMLDINMVPDLTDELSPKVITFYKDITNEYESKKVLKQKNIELNQYIESNSQLKQFAHIVSHDLKSPVRTITSFISLLKNSARSKLNDKEKEYIEYVYSSGIHMAKLIDDLLEFSKVNSNKINIKKVNIEAMLDHIILLLKNLTNDKNAAIVKEGNFPEIYGDEIKLKRVFQNIITNAIKFSDPSKENIIRIKCEKIENTYRFHFIDNGIGIEDLQVDIFKPFIRLNKQSDFEGTGMGLAICREIINQHEGQISYTSELGKGTTFTIELPVIDPN